MKLAVLFFGKSKCKHYHYWNHTTNVIDYEKSYENYQKYIFDFFKSKGYDIDVYFSTNILNDIDRKKICETYNPVKCNYIEDITVNTEQDNNLARNTKFDNVLDLCIQSGITYDLILITRFDLLFKKDFNQSNIDLDKFNLVSILERPNLVCDNFYLFPYNFLEKFSIISKKYLYKRFHDIQSDLYDSFKRENVNYILNEGVLVKDLSFYKVYSR